MNEGFRLIAVGSVGMALDLLLAALGARGGEAPYTTLVLYAGVILVLCGVARIGWVIGQDARRGMNTRHK